MYGLKIKRQNVTLGRKLKKDIRPNEKKAKIRKAGNFVGRKQKC